jgi:hypothetical protein
MRQLRQILNVSLITSALMLFGTTAHAQYGQPGGPYQPDSVSSLIERVHSDLSRGYDVWRLPSGDRERLDKAGKQLREFASDWRKGKFDKGDLDDAIGAIQKVVDKNRLAGAERDALWSDVEQLRQMREAYNRHEIGRW